MLGTGDPNEWLWFTAVQCNSGMEGELWSIIVGELALLFDRLSKDQWTGKQPGILHLGDRYPIVNIPVDSLSQLQIRKRLLLEHGEPSQNLSPSERVSYLWLLHWP